MASKLVFIGGGGIKCPPAIQNAFQMPLQVGLRKKLPEKKYQARESEMKQCQNIAHQNFRVYDIFSSLFKSFLLIEVETDRIIFLSINIYEQFNLKRFKL